MNESANPEARLAQLESMLAHQQHALDAINEVVIEQNKTIDLLRRRMKRLESSVEAVQSQLPGEERDPLAEKPPHY